MYKFQVAAHAPLLFHIPGLTDAGIQVDQLVINIYMEIVNHHHHHQRHHHHRHHHHRHHHDRHHHHRHHHHHHRYMFKVEFVDIFPTVADAAELDPLQLCPESSNTTLLCTEVVFKKKNLQENHLQ